MFGHVPSYVRKEVRGDGFATDSWTQIVGVRGWDQCESEEMIRVFPQLVQGRGLATPVRLQLVRSLNALNRDRYPSTISHANIFRWKRSHGRRMGIDCRISSREGRRQSARKAIGDVVNAFDPGITPPYDEASAREIAFWAGVHPAYIWREALVSHDHFTALGWLGYAERKGRALLPLDVAEFFLDAVEPSEGGLLTLADIRISQYISNVYVLTSLYRASRRRREGFEEVFDAFFIGRAAGTQSIECETHTRTA